eukprot:TRINITY_DN8943_c0_g2_i1.p1 TRINITY_DN8943_c0_g2~~TRINITY_DN8943_c0_g2_i1.p1  ORF type:complete len:656 (-),score=57.22 TRINITY_DN8943_c0_g2_i1:361-2328(-)
MEGRTLFSQLSQRQLNRDNSEASRKEMELENEKAAMELIANRVISVNNYTWDVIRTRQFGDNTDSSSKRLSSTDLVGMEELKKKRSIIGFPIISPNHRFAIMWSLLTILLDTVYTAFALPIFIAFVNNDNERSWEDFIDLAAGFIFTVDFVLNFHMAYMVKYHGQLMEVRDGAIISYYYIFKGSFLVDIIMVATFFLQLVVIGLDDSEGAEVLKWILLFFRLLRLVRVVRLIKEAFLSSMTSSDSPLMRYMSATTLHMVSLVFTTAVIVNFLGCVWFFVAERSIEWGDFEEPQSWIIDYLDLADNAILDRDIIQDLVNEQKPHFYLGSVYFALTTVTTVGYGDITPSNDAERVTAMLIFMCGVIFFSFQISSVTELLSNVTHKQRRSQRIREKMTAVKRWMKHRHLDANIRQQIAKFYSDVWVLQQEDQEEEFLNEIPQNLRTAVAFQLTEKSLQSITLFKYINDKFLQLIASRFQPLFIPQGNDIYREGDDATAVYILDEGEITITNKLKKLGKVFAPEVIGEASLLQDQDEILKQRIVTLTCSKECRLWKLEIEDLNRLMKLSPELKEGFMRGLQQYVIEKIDEFTPGVAYQVQQKLLALEAGVEDIDDNLPYDGALIAMIRTLKLEGKLPLQQTDKDKKNIHWSHDQNIPMN